MRYQLRRTAIVGFALTAAVALAASGGATSAAAATPPTGRILGAGTAGAIPDSYIVVLKDGGADPSAVHATSRSLAGTVGGQVRHEYTHALRGFSASLTRSQAGRLAADPAVAYVEQNHRYHAAGTQASPPSWGLDRIDQTYQPLSKSYQYPSTGAGVTVYVIDSGIRITNTDFGGRASYGPNFVADGATNSADCYGHGTQVASTIGGATYGVAKGVNLVAVRVLDCNGNSDDATMMQGIDWVTANAAKPAVANISVSSTLHDTSTALDNEVTASINSGVTYAVAAGNDGDDACGSSPADVPGAITVGATDVADFRASFSNYGSCVDLFAPGVNIVSASNASDTATATTTGTSAAAPHVAGAAALLLGTNPTLTPAQVATQITGNAVPMTVHDAGTNSPNLLLNVDGTGTPTTLGFKAHANGLIVSADSGGASPLIANRWVEGAWETFDIVPQTGGFIALRAHANNMYVTADSAGASPLIANRTTVGVWEEFTLIHNADGSVSLLANANGKYVSADSGGASALIANRTSIGQWESFDETGPLAQVTLLANANSKLVTADNAGTTPLIAGGATSGRSEYFDIIDLGGGWIALNADANQKIVTADSAGKNPLINNRTSAGVWERFYMSQQLDGSIALLAGINTSYVTADSAGASPLIANRSQVGIWEKFFVQPH